MTPWLRPSFLAIAAIALAACETGRAAYDGPLRDAGVLKDEQAAANKGDGTASQAANASSNTADIQNNEDYFNGDAFSYEGNTYRLADLSPGERPALSSDEAGLWRSMDRFEQQLTTSGSLVRDAELLSYIRNVACRVAGDHCDSVRVFVIENPTFNASMAPNGLMMVHTGLLLRTRNEAELAAVLGHEIGHYLRRHSYQRMKDIVDKTNFLVFFQIALAAGGVPAPVGQASQIFVLGSLAAFSRDNEREADGYGSLLLHQVGYDPREAANIWARITQENEAKDEDEQRPIFYASHPPTKERQQVLADLGEKLAVKMPQKELGRDRFLEIAAPRRANWLRQETHLRQFKRSESLFDMMLEDGINPAELHYFKGELYRLRNEDEDAKTALASYEKALAAKGAPPPEIYRSMGLLYRQQDKNKQATAAFRNYLTHVPDAEDRLFIENLIGTMSTS